MTGRRSESGFTLVETVMALAVLTVLLLATSTTLAATARASAATRERALAAEAARGQIEEIVAWPDFASVQATFDGLGFAAVAGARTLAARAGDADGLCGRVTVRPAGAGLLRVSVRVEWRGLAGEDAVALETFVAERGE